MDGLSSPPYNRKYSLISVEGSGYIWIKSNNASMETSSVNVNALTEYNGSSFKNLRQISPNFLITSSIGWNGKYWLIGGQKYYGGGVVKYKGHVVSKSPPHVKYEILFLDSGLNTVKEIEIPLKPYYIYPLEKILLVTGVKKVKIPNSYKNSYSYSYNLTTLLVNPGNKNISSFNVTVLDAGFNGTTGLIFGKDTHGNMRILKYNGKKFTDLTPQLKAALQHSAAQTHKSYPVTEKHTNYKNIILVIVVVLLLALVVYSLVRLRRRQR